MIAVGVTSAGGRGVTDAHGVARLELELHDSVTPQGTNGEVLVLAVYDDGLGFGPALSVAKRIAK